MCRLCTRKNVRMTISVFANIITLLESVNTSAGINELLLAGKERMAIGADIYTKVFGGGSGLKGSAAGTLNNGGLVVGMDSLLHNIFHLFRRNVDINKQSKYIYHGTISYFRLNSKGSISQGFVKCKHFFTFRNTFSAYRRRSAQTRRRR